MKNVKAQLKVRERSTSMKHTIGHLSIGYSPSQTAATKSSRF